MTRSTFLAFALCMASSTHAVEVYISAFDATCFQCNGVATANASGGLPPYSYLWSPTPPAGQGTPTITGLCAGEYSVEVTDGMGQTAVATVTINMLGGLNMFVPATELQYACDGGCTGWAVASLTTMGGTAPYSFDHPFAEVNGTSVTFAGLCAGSNQITVTDVNGCAGTIQTNISSSGIGFPGILSTSPACGTLANGSVTMPGEFGSDIAYLVQSPTFDSIYNFGSSTGPYVLGGIPAGTHTVYYWWNQGGINGIPSVAYCTAGTDFTIGALSGPCGQVYGRVYHDADEDCTFNGFDLGLPYRVLTIEPGNQFAITDGEGNYQRNLDLGSYTIDQGATVNEAPLCPASPNAAFTLDATTPNVTQDFANLSTVPHDISVSITSTAARPGFATQVFIQVTNNSAFPSGAVTVAVSYDNILLNPSTASWNIPVLAPYAAQHFTFSAMVPANIGLLGANLNYGVTATNSLTELNAANNTAFVDVTITGSYDPNDKRGLTSSRASDDRFFLDQDDHLDYTVRFQNTGTDTAFTVVIRDVLDTDLDITSLRILGASHDFVPSFGEDRELVFTFNDIGLPDSTTDLLGSQGYISYRIKPIEDLAIGDVIENTAGIYFDFNPPIITNTTSHVVDFSTSAQQDVISAPSLKLAPNPVHDRLSVHWPDGPALNWSMHGIDGRSVRPPFTVSAGVLQLDVRLLDPGTYVVHSEKGNATFVKY